MGCVAGCAPFCFEGCVLVSEWTLLVGVTLYAGRIGAGFQPGLLEFKAAVRVVTVAALHFAFEHLVMKRLVEVGLNFVVAAYAQLRFADLEQITSGEVGLLSVGFVDEGDRLRNVSISG